jgi:hypothetical protein
MTPQVGRHDSKLKARQSVGGSANRYIDLDHDLEQARKRLAELGPVSRPQLVDPNEGPSKAHTAPRPTKRPRASIADAPDLSSPLPASKAKFSIAQPSMATIPEPHSSLFKEPEAEHELNLKGAEEEEDDSVLRLQRLMRTVEDVNRRESIRESRRSLAGPNDGYLPITAFKTPALPSLSSTKSPPLSSQSGMPLRDVVMMDDTHQEDSDRTPAFAEEEDTSAKESESAQPKRAGRKPAKSGTTKSSTATKRATTTKKRVYEEMMDVDEADASSAQQTSVDHSMQTQEDVKMEDESDSVPVTQGRTTRAPAASAATKRGQGKTMAARKAKAVVEASQESGDAEVKQEVDEVCLFPFLLIHSCSTRLRYVIRYRSLPIVWTPRWKTLLLIRQLLEVVAEPVRLHPVLLPERKHPVQKQLESRNPRQKQRLQLPLQEEREEARRPPKLLSKKTILYKVKVMGMQRMRMKEMKTNWISSLRMPLEPERPVRV